MSAAVASGLTTSARTASPPAPYVLSPSARHFARRFTGGITQRLAIQIQHRGGGQSWFASQLAPGQLKDTYGDEIDTWWPSLDQTPKQIFDTQMAGGTTSYEVVRDLSRWTVARQVHSNRQVKESMVTFFSNLLHVPIAVDPSIFWRVDYDQTIRRYALDTFENLLQAAITHPAMGLNLNNSESTKDAPNENLGRELLELHTVGVGAGYTEDDVKASAKLLTGYRVYLYSPEFKAEYVPGDHYVGPVSVMGFSHPNADPDGRAAVQAYLSYLARHPATATRLARRLCVKYVNETPSDDLVATVAQAYLDNDTAIAPTLLAMVGHPEFLDPVKTIGTKVRTPMEDFVATLRSLNTQIQRPITGDETSFANAMYWKYVYLGNAPFQWPAPNGFPEVNAAWCSAGRVLTCFDMHRSMALKLYPTAQAKLWGRRDLLPRNPTTLSQVINTVALRVLGEPATPEIRRGVATVLAMPLSRVLTFTDTSQIWFMRTLLCTLLDSPLHLKR